MFVLPLKEDGILLEKLSSAYFIADTLEQWLLPVMTVANCIVYTVTNKKIRLFSRWYFRKAFYAVCTRTDPALRRYTCDQRPVL